MPYLPLFKSIIKPCVVCSKHKYNVKPSLWKKNHNHDNPQYFHLHTFDPPIHPLPAKKKTSGY